MLALVLALPAIARAVPTQLVSESQGLAMPVGIARTPDGGLWVSDDSKGICRIKLDPVQVVEDGVWCDSGGLGSVGAPGQLAFDPATSNFYVADGKSNAGGVWRLHWNALTGAIDSGTMILSLPNDRALGLALSPSGALDFTTKRTNIVRRIHDPAGSANPVETIGSAQLEAVPSIAHLGEAIYLAETTGVTVIASPGSAGSAAVSVPGFPGGMAASVAADPMLGRVYAGTDNHNAQDQVDVLSPLTGAIETYQAGFAGVTALAVDGGPLLVGDDPANAAGGQGVASGRIWSVPLAGLGRPQTTIDGGPPTISNLDNVTFAYSAPTAKYFECRIDGKPWTLCGGFGSGSRTYDSAGQGTHTFDVRAVDMDPLTGVGNPTRRTFVIDQTAPVPAIDSPTGDMQEGEQAVMRFTADELHTTFRCSLDGALPERCKSPRPHGQLAVGAHTFWITATDLAGNVSDPVVRSFSVLAPPPPPPPPAPPAQDPPVRLPVAPQPQQQAAPPAPKPPAPGLRAVCAKAPQTSMGFRPESVRVSRRMLQLVGWADDTSCAGPLRISVARLTPASAAAKRSCRFLNKRAVLGRARSCAKRVYLPVKGGGAWWTATLRSAAGFRPGQYVAIATMTRAGGGAAMGEARYRFTVR